MGPASAWAGLRIVPLVQTERRLVDSAERDSRYDSSSLPADLKRITAAGRGHWGIENWLHWVLDITMREDECPVRNRHAAENFAVLRQRINLLRRETTTRTGVKATHLEARAVSRSGDARRLPDPLRHPRSDAFTTTLRSA